MLFLMRLPSARASAVLLALALVGSCDNPICACSPEPIRAFLETTVRNTADEPVEGLRLRAEASLDANCASYRDTFLSRVTDAAGSARFTIDGPASDSICVRLFASDSAPGSPEVLLPDRPKLLASIFPFDTVRVVLVLPP